MVTADALRTSLRAISTQIQYFVKAFDEDVDPARRAAADAASRNNHFGKVADAIDIHMVDLRRYERAGVTPRYPDPIKYVMQVDDGMRQLLAKSFVVAQAVFPQGNDDLNIVSDAYRQIGFEPPTHTGIKAVEEDIRTIQNALTESKEQERTR